LKPMRPRPKLLKKSKQIEQGKNSSDAWWVSALDLRCICVANGWFFLLLFLSIFLYESTRNYFFFKLIILPPNLIFAPFIRAVDPQAKHTMGQLTWSMDPHHPTLWCRIMPRGIQWKQHQNKAPWPRKEKIKKP
jgi:hypothetical protein